jgi:hypothetical protein
MKNAGGTLLGWPNLKIIRLFPASLSASLHHMPPEAIAQLVLWIGYFQWQRKTTGKGVPDESATIALFDDVNPRRAEWPQADCIVGNPPFIESFLEGRDGQGRDAFPTRPADGMRMNQPKNHSQDLALDAPSSPHSSGPFGKRSLPLHLAYGIPDHPWIDSAAGAAVRIAMTVGAPGIDKHIRGDRNGKDLTNRPRNVKLIDLFGLSEAETMSRFPSLYQHVLIHVSWSLKSGSWLGVGNDSVYVISRPHAHRHV